MGGVYTAFLGVVAALKIKFAKAAMLSVAVANMAKKPIDKYVCPAFSIIVAPEYKQWVPIGIDYSVKLMAVTFAWWIQRVVSAIHSAIRGGRMFSTSLFLYLNEAGIIPLDPTTTKADEIVGWVLAAIGLYVQVSLGFSLLFPLNFLFLPLTFMNGALEWI
eukprot:8045828-Pyramimonas_sp.AAC.1